MRNRLVLLLLCAGAQVHTAGTIRVGGIAIATDDEVIIFTHENRERIHAQMQQQNEREFLRLRDKGDARTRRDNLIFANLLMVLADEFTQRYFEQDQ